MNRRVNQATNISLIGFGISTISAARYFAQFQNLHIRISEAKTLKALDSKQIKLYEELSKEFSNIEFQFGEQNLDFITYKLVARDTRLIIVLSPGIPPQAPILQELKNNGYEYFSDFDVFLEINTSPCVAVTGTNGKTTTTSLIAHILGTEALGNIGKPFLDFDPNLSSALALELSSFQLYYSKLLGPDLCPEVSVYLNFTDDHLDWHKDLQEYQESKAKLFPCSQSIKNNLVLNYDDSTTRALAFNLEKTILEEESLTRLACFSTRQKLEPTQLMPRVAYHQARKFYLAKLIQDSQSPEEGMIVSNTDGDYFSLNLVLGEDDINLVGEHNYSNILAAILAADCLNIPLDEIQTQVSSFQAVKHRLELVGEINSHKCYNDSKATNPDSANKALESFEKSVAIVGGKDKHLDLSGFVDKLVERCVGVVIIGELRSAIAESLAKRSFTNYREADSLEQALALALDLAKPYPKIAIVLAPASSSFDMFKNYEDRGNQFRALVSLQSSRNEYIL